MSTAARIDELLSKFDENPRRYFAPLANEYRKAGDLTQAIALCQEHLPKQPGHMSGHIVFGQALFEHGDLAEAQTVFEAALALDPENLIALRHLGDIARGRGDALLARRWYGRVLEADPRNDDIAALLASLPSRATPIATPAVPSPANDEPAALAHSFDDEPAWHTPAILGGHSEPSPEEMEGEAVAELLDLDSPVEAAAEVPSFIGAAPTETTPEDEAFGAEPESETAFDALLELDATALPPSEEVAFEVLQIEELAAESDAEAVWSDAELDQESPRDSLADAIGAFSAHDPLDSATASAIDTDVGGWQVESVATDVPAVDESAMTADATEYGDGLDSIEWPDASQLSVRPPSPARSVTPVEAWPTEAWPAEAWPAEAWPAEAWPTVAAAPESEEIESPLVVSADAVEELIEVESLVEVSGEADANEFVMESLENEADANEFEVESLVEAPDDAEEPDFVVESLVEAPDDAEEPDFVVESLVELRVEADEPDSVVESLLDAPVDSSGEFAEPAPDDAEPAAPIDEDPPLNAGEMPWLMISEEEREAEETDLLEASALPESPAFVTETMAELLVAQGFVARAIGVYEELLARRPDDLALSSRLATLRASLEPQVAASESALSEPVEHTRSATPIAPLGAFTPARSSTPRRSTPLSVPFIAPAPRRTAREWLSLLAAMQVARRTSASDLVVVSMPTPADGLAILFGASPLPADDVAARSLATAYGGAVPLDSSAPLFASGEFTVPADSPREPMTASPSEPTNGSGLYSFDRFFPDPATTANGPSASSEAPAASSPTGPLSDDPTSPGADLAQFSHWLKGLSNS